VDVLLLRETVEEAEVEDAYQEEHFERKLVSTNWDNLSAIYWFGLELTSSCAMESVYRSSGIIPT